MIAEPGVLSTSPWNSDILLKDFSSDFIKTYLNTNDGLDTGFPILDVDTDRARSSRDGKVGVSSSGSPSSASSDCSEDLSFDFICSSSSSILHIPDHDYLNTSLNLLEDDSMSVCPQDFDWVVGDSFVNTGSMLCDDAYCERFPECLVSPIARENKCIKSPDPVMDSKLWSKMTLEEQLEAVEGLTTVISKELGLREQLDIIRIIDPTAVISPTDTEFVIDLTSLNDEKLCRVREYVRKVLSSNQASTCNESQQSLGKSCLSSKGVNLNSSLQKSEGTSNTAKNKCVKREIKERRAPQKVLRQRQKKEHRQLLKERRSGLFVREEVLSLSVDPIIEDTDIDILG